MSDDSCCPVIELRQYTLQPGQRDVLIDLFDREFVETQEAIGMRLVGQFRDVERPDRFVWIRGFPDMPRARNFAAGVLRRTGLGSAPRSRERDDDRLRQRAAAASGDGDICIRTE